MLPAHLQELLTAAVDGEMTHAERRMVDTLLRDSEEARGFHAQILRDAGLLRNSLPQVPADDLATGVMAIISERGIKPTPLPTRRRQPAWTSGQWLPWLSVATAAMVLIAVSIVSYLFFAATQTNSPKPSIESAANPTNAQPKTGSTKPKFNDPKVEEPLFAEAGPMPREAPILVVKNDMPTGPELLNVPPRISPFNPEDGQFSPLPPETQRFKVVPINLALLLPLKDLDQPYPKKQLRDELKKDEIYRLDLFCRDSTKAAELLQAGFRARGQQLIVDSVAQDRLKKRLKTEYVYFTESFTVEEIAALLEALGSDDKKAEEKKAGDGLFDKFLLTPFVAEDARELSKLLGVPLNHLKLPHSKISLDPRKSLESNTVSHLSSTLPQGGASRSDKFTLVLPNGPFADPRTSKEIKSFLDKRTNRKPGTVPLMLVLRSLG